MKGKAERVSEKKIYDIGIFLFETKNIQRIEKKKTLKNKKKNNKHTEKEK